MNTDSLCYQCSHNADCELEEVPLDGTCGLFIEAGSRQAQTWEAPEAEVKVDPTPDEILRQYQEFFARSLQDLSFELGKHNLAVGELQITRQDHQSPYGYGTALDSQTFFALITTFSRGKNRMGDEDE